MSLEEHFSGGGGKYAKFDSPGRTYTGRILAVHPREHPTEYGTGRVLEDKWQVRIDLSTSERDPLDADDDGRRTLYVTGWMTGAVSDALHKVGARVPAVDGVLTVTYTQDGQPRQPGFRGPKQYVASYQPPAAASTAEHFAAPVAAPVGPPPGIDASAWAVMPEDAKKAVLASLTPAAPGGTPPF